MTKSPFVSFFLLFWKSVLFKKVHNINNPRKLIPAKKSLNGQTAKINTHEMQFFSEKKKPRKLLPLRYLGSNIPQSGCSWGFFLCVKDHSNLLLLVCLHCSSKDIYNYLTCTIFWKEIVLLALASWKLCEILENFQPNSSLHSRVLSRDYKKIFFKTCVRNFLKIHYTSDIIT